MVRCLSERVWASFLRDASRVRAGPKSRRMRILWVTQKQGTTGSGRQFLIKVGVHVGADRTHVRMWAQLVL